MHETAEPKFIPLEFARLAPDEQARRAAELRDLLAVRRTVRHFSTEPVARDLVEAIVATAATAPSGANQQPWRFMIVANPEIKRQIRLAAEAEERENYGRRFPDAWKQHLEPLGTDWRKPFLEDAPYLIVVFRIDRTPTEKHYYVMESVGIACGFLIAAIHNAGLATVTHTPNPMGFLTRILERPVYEKPYLLLPVGYPAPDAEVPNIRRKPFDEVATFVD
jgi:iodotyrosine deiodinase